jgi:2-phospho-L-lactate guanylyltransferase
VSVWPERAWVVIPVKAPAECKTRLSAVLDAAGRRDLVAEMVRRTVDAASAVVGVEAVRLLGPSRHGRAQSIGLLADPGGGLNAALASARDAALAKGVERLVLLSADLPLVEPDDVAALVAVDGVGGAPDLAGTGTNALSLPLPQAAGFRFHYGEGSFAAHEGEAARLGLGFSAMVRPGLGFDVDQPGDLVGWR